MANSSGNDTFLKPCACGECLIKIERAYDFFGNFVLHQLQTVNVWSPNGESVPAADFSKVFQQIEAAYQLMKRYTRTLTKRHNVERAVSICPQSPVATPKLNVSTQTEATNASNPDEELINLSNADIDWLLSEIQRIDSLSHSPLPTLPAPPSDNVPEGERSTEPLNVSMTPHREVAHCSSQLLPPPTDGPNAPVRGQIIVKRLKCPVADCKKSFPLRKSLQMHLRQRHGIEKYSCHVRRCKASFEKVHQMVAHRKSAHKKLRRWPCGGCSKQFLTYSRLSTHHRLLHEMGRFTCSSDGCPFVASNRSKVKTHYRFEHILPTRACPYAGCARAFKYPYLLAKHQLTHRYRKSKK